MPRRYPLEPLRSVRQAQVRRRAGDLAEQATRTRQAHDQQSAAQQATDAERQHNQAVLAQEQSRLHAGQTRAGDLAQAAEWGRGASRRETEMRAVQRATEARLEAARQDEASARRALTQAHADAAAVERHRQHWQREQGRRDEAAEQEASEEAWGSGSRRGPGEHS